METVLRVAVLYAFVFVGLRLIGKRDFGQLSPFELITLLLIPEMISQALMREDFSVTNALIGVSTLFLLVFLTSAISHASKRAERLLEGEPTVLVSHGAFVEKHLNRERVPPGEVFAEMHKAGYERLEQVRWAILETDGRISFVPAEGAPLPTRQQDRVAG